MKKELIAFDLDPSVLNDMFNSLSIDSQVKVEDTNIVSFVPASEVQWDDSMPGYQEHFSELKEDQTYVNVKKMIRVFEESISDSFGGVNEGEVNTLSDELRRLKKDIELYFSEENSDPLSVYPLFSRWFTACAILNAQALKAHGVSCIDCVSFWKSSKNYLDKSLVYMIVRLRATLHKDKDKDKDTNNKIITSLQGLNIFKNFQLLTILESSLEVKENSLVKKENLLHSDTLINNVIKDLLNS